MYTPEPFLLAMLALAIGDLVLQTNWISSNKGSLRSPGTWYHAIEMFIITLMLLHPFGLRAGFLIAILAAVAHVVVDSILKPGPGRPSLQILLFTAEQAIHTYILAWLTSTFAPPLDPAVMRFWRLIVPRLPAGLETGVGSILFSNVAIATAITYVYVACAGSTIIRLVLDSIGFEGPRDLPQSGKYIGILERVIILTFMLTNSLTAAAFVLTAKSIVRYPRLDDSREFAEYHLVGTLASILVALAGGLMLRLVATALSTGDVLANVLIL